MYVLDVKQARDIEILTIFKFREKLTRFSCKNCVHTVRTVLPTVEAFFIGILKLSQPPRSIIENSKHNTDLQLDINYNDPLRVLQVQLIGFVHGITTFKIHTISVRVSTSF